MPRRACGSHPPLDARLRHRDVVGVALRRLHGQLSTEEKEGVVEAIRKELRKE